MAVQTFKAGDRVNVSCGITHYYGKGTVAYRDDHGYAINTDTSNPSHRYDGTLWVLPNKLELISETKTTGDDKMTKFNAGDKVNVNSLIYTGTATFIKEDRGVTDSDGALVNPDGKALVSRSDDRLWVHMKDLTPAAEAEAKVNPFKVGDIVTGTAEADEWYTITTSKMTKGEVVEVDGDKIKVRVLEHEDGPSAFSTYLVKAKRFELVKDEVKPKFKVGDIVAGTKGNGYYVTNEQMTKGEVVDVDEDEIEVVVREHERSYEVGSSYTVQAKHFVKVEAADTAKFKAGDKVALKLDGEVLTLKERKPEKDGTFGAAWSVEEYPSEMWTGEEQVEEAPKFKTGDKVRAKELGSIYTLGERRPDKDGRYGKAWGIVGKTTWLGEEQIELVEEAPKKTESIELTVTPQELAVIVEAIGSSTHSKLRESKVVPSEHLADVHDTQSMYATIRGKYTDLVEEGAFDSE